MQNLLPGGRAWRLPYGSQIRQFFSGLTDTGADVKEFADLVWLDTQPETTRVLTEWENEFGLPDDPSLTNQERIERLNGEWSATGGQSPRYIQDVLRSAGFDVYVYEWWVPGSDPVVTRDPNAYVNAATSKWRCGMPGARCGIPEVRCTDDAIRTDPYILTTRGLDSYTPPSPPADSAKWPYVFYISSDAIGTEAEISASRRLDFERLLSLIKPAYLWAGVIVKYV